jgi:hypothetical protein
MKKSFILLIGFLFLGAILVAQTTFDTKAFGQKILDGKIKPTADKQTFQLIDSLFCKNENNRDFYLRVANKIALKSDGALSEYICQISNKFYFNNTTYFITASKSMSIENLSKWLKFVATDLYMNNRDGVKGLPKIRVEIDKTAAKFLNISYEQMSLRKKYNDFIYTLTEKLVKAD